MKALWALWAWLNAQAGWVFLPGFAVVVCWNTRRWQQDRSLARQRRSENTDPVRFTASPKVSVLVAAWNEARMIGEHITSFLQLGYPNRELILCAGGADGAHEIASQYAGEQLVVLQQQPGEGKQRALQRCLDRASGEVIFLTDADCLLDDESFARTLAPILQEGQQVSTGTSRPLHRQLDNPFVLHQWCADMFGTAHRPDYVTAILGRNVALRREALQQVGEFRAEVQTGTDYHIGKLLLAHGYRVRYVRDSAAETRYPEAFRSYWRRQSRWVRNLMVHGPAFGAYDEAASALRTSVVGWAMLLLPFASLVVGPIVLAVWALMFAHAFLAKLRYARFARAYEGIEIPAKQYLLTPLYVFVDLIAWSLPLLDLLAGRHQW